MPLASLLRRLRGGRPIVVVSGLPRSGTSLLMQMLAAGGVPAASDGIRRSDADNPRGYFELERVKELDKGGDASWLGRHRGEAVKIISFLLRHLPRQFNYRVVFVERDLEEVLVSQRRMLARRGEEAAGGADDAVREAFVRHLRQVRSLLASEPCFRALFVGHRDLLQGPQAEAARINAFLGGRLDTAAMAAAVDRDLYRSRPGR